MGKSEEEIEQIAGATLEGHQRAIMGNMTVEVRLILVSFIIVVASVRQWDLVWIVLFHANPL